MSTTRTANQWLPALAAALLAAGALGATSVPRMSFEHVVRSSPRAFRGVVTRIWSGWDPGRTSIWTHYEIRVTETLRGPGGPTFTISEPGGVVGDLEMRVPGAPRFTVGEQAVVFAYQTPLGYWRVRGWGQGRFRIDEDNGRHVVRLPQTDASLLDLRSPLPKAAAAQQQPDVESLDSFLERVRGLIRQEQAR